MGFPVRYGFGVGVKLCVGWSLWGWEFGGGVLVGAFIPGQNVCLD
jgi:hypothetical protein